MPPVSSGIKNLALYRKTQEHFWVPRAECTPASCSARDQRPQSAQNKSGHEGAWHTPQNHGTRLLAGTAWGASGHRCCINISTQCTPIGMNGRGKQLTLRTWYSQYGFYRYFSFQTGPSSSLWKWNLTNSWDCIFCFSFKLEFMYFEPTQWCGQKTYKCRQLVNLLIKNTPASVLV